MPEFQQSKLGNQNFYETVAILNNNLSLQADIHDRKYEFTVLEYFENCKILKQI